MPRIARVVMPGELHHVTERGNRRQRTFFGDEDCAEYLALMAHWCESWGVQVWAWCLMPNHAHLIAAPETEEGLRRAIGEAHRRYTRRVNFREGWRGHLRGEDDLLTRMGPLLELVPDWAAHLAEDVDEPTLNALRSHERTGRPLGSEEFVVELEGRLGRLLQPRRPGRKRNEK